VDRRNSGQVDFHEDFAADMQTAPLEIEGNSISLEILVDKSSIEVFANIGQRSITNRIFPSESSDGIEIFSEGGTVDVQTLDFHTLKSVWNK
jgi:fructan beta-fructosidase